MGGFVKSAFPSLITRRACASNARRTAQKNLSPAQTDGKTIAFAVFFIGMLFALSNWLPQKPKGIPYMKKILCAFVLCSLAIVSSFASGGRDLTTIEGKLAVTDGTPCIVVGDTSWALPSGPFYQLAWENGVKVGDAIKAEGYGMTPPTGASIAGSPPMMGPGGAQSPRAQKADMPSMKGPEGSDASQALFIPIKVWVNGKQIDLSTVKGEMPRPMLL